MQNKQNRTGIKSFSFKLKFRRSESGKPFDILKIDSVRKGSDFRRSDGEIISQISIFICFKSIIREG